MANTFKYGWQSLYYLLLGYGSYLMVLITAQYIPLRLDVAFLNVKQDALAYGYYPVAFFSHVFSSIVVLLLGGTQFSAWVRLWSPTLHRNFGKTYVALILLVASPSGLVMALHANGGLGARVSFVLQALLWWAWTYGAWRAALRQNWERHHLYMLLSYALTLSAVSLRFWKWAIVGLWAPPPMDTYRIVAWLGWMGNVVLVGGYWVWVKKS